MAPQLQQSHFYKREIGEECVRCKKLRRKYLEESFMVAPLPSRYLWAVPSLCYLEIVNFSRLKSKCYVMAFVCLITRAVNVQDIENKSVDGVIEGVNRLSREVGFPSYILTDQDTVESCRSWQTLS